MKSDNITVTDARLHRALDRKIDQRLKKKNIPQMIEKKVNDAKIHTGRILKFYHYKDKALVRLSNNKDVVCKILHRMDGSIIDFYTPEGERIWCEDLKEPCISPRAKLDVLVLDINDKTEEQVILGFFKKDDVVYTAPAEQGHYKIVNIGATNQIGLDIGQGEINIKTMSGVNFTQGEYRKEDQSVEYANSENTPTLDDVYTREFLYTKQEVDELIKKAIDDLKEELDIDTDDNNNDDDNGG